MNKKKALKLLEETANHYNSNNRSLNGDDCVYIPKDKTKSEGCAIGRKLPKWAKRQVLERGLNAKSVVTLCNNLSKPVKALKGLKIDFLAQLQTLHDGKRYWNESGLSVAGKEKVERIKEMFKL